VLQNHATGLPQRISERHARLGALAGTRDLDAVARIWLLETPRRLALGQGTAADLLAARPNAAGDATRLARLLTEMADDPAAAGLAMERRTPARAFALWRSASGSECVGQTREKLMACIRCRLDALLGARPGRSLSQDRAEAITASRSAARGGAVRPATAARSASCRSETAGAQRPAGRTCMSAGSLRVCRRPPAFGQRNLTLWSGVRPSS
jgi:hypothetical protein